MTQRLRVVIASGLAPENVALLADLEPRLDIVYEPELLPPASADSMLTASRTPLEEEKFRALVDTAEALFGVPDQSGKALARTVAVNPRLRWVHTIPAGGGQQVRAARLGTADLERIVFTTSAGVHAVPLAEFALFGVLAGAKRLPELWASAQRREWSSRREFGHARDLTVAVVGLGAIGREVARLHAGVGFRVEGVHRRPVLVDGVSVVHPVDELADVAARVDAIVACLPATEATHHLFNADVFAAARPGFTFVNVGRGSTVDESALIEALRSQRCGFAALDVTEVEPLPEESPLWDLPNVVISPHTAAISRHEPRLITELFADNARRLLDGEPLRNVVNTVEFY